MCYYLNDIVPLARGAFFNQPMNTISTWSHIVSIIILTDALWLKCRVVFINFHILCFQCGSSGRGHKLLKEYKVIMNFIYMKKLLFCTKYCQATLNRLSAMSMNKINYHSPHLSFPPPFSSLSPPPHPPPLSSLSLLPFTLPLSLRISRIITR